MIQIKHSLPNRNICKMNCDINKGFRPDYVKDPASQGCFTCNSEDWPKKFYDRHKNNCQDCNASCYMCDGPLSNNCTSCPPESDLPKGAEAFDLQEGVCKVTCKPDFYFKKKDLEDCGVCDKSCSKCRGPLPIDCLENACIMGFQYTQQLGMCTPVCSEAKYFDILSIKCVACPALVQCWTCGPGKNDCLNAESCKIGYKWDESQQHTCKIELNVDSLKDLGLNPERKYFVAEPEEPEIEEEQSAALSGDQNEYSSGDSVEFTEEKTIIFATDSKIKFLKPCVLEYTDKLTGNVFKFTRSAGDEFSLPAGVENKFSKDCAIEFTSDVKTLERKEAENVEQEIIVSNDPVSYKQEDILVINGETITVKFEFNTKVEFKSDSN
jgi:hypothetical protein